MCHPSARKLFRALEHTRAHNDAARISHNVLSLPSMDDTEHTSSTSLVEILSSVHGRQRQERLINMRDLKAAVKYGKKEANVSWQGIKNCKYTFAGIVFITDETSTCEITSWVLPAFGFDVPLVHITEGMHREHTDAVRALQDKSMWTSHTVIVVDQSGSMRKTDVEGGATRSDAVWITLALTWVQDEIFAGTRTSTDVLSVVSMRNNSELIVDAEPVDWLLFNKLIAFLRTSMPGEHGNYVQAINLADKCLMRNTVGSCALALLFSSDGKPSEKYKKLPTATKMHLELYEESEKRAMLIEALDDAREQEIAGRIGALASRFGRRLTVGNIGFAAPSEEFSTLQAMTDACAAYQCQASFHKPTLTAQLLHSILTGLSSTLTNTKTDLTAIGGSKQRTVRDVRRESQFQVTEETVVTEQDWWSYSREDIIVRQVWGGGRRRGWSKTKKLIHPDADGVAMRNQIFGEGAERIVSKFREFDVAGKFVGPWMVAKQNRFIDDENDEDHAQFHRSFCSTQQTAGRIALKFNERLATIPGVTSSTPRIKFLDCQVYLIYDANLARRNGRSC